MVGGVRSLGERVALDDFGAGYSSLTYLRQLPIDTMKIDRSFVSELPSNNQSGSIMASLQQLAQSLHLDVVAEGVAPGLSRLVSWWTSGARACRATTLPGQCPPAISARGSPAI